MPNNTHIHEMPVSWEVDDLEVSATLLHPEGEGPFPAVIFVAGSGPTDRSWNTPLLPGSNGSGALLAKVLAENGFVTLRYDKRGSGPQANENAKRLAGKISLQGHIDELAGGIKLLRRDPKVDPNKIFALTNSEGCVHALNFQTQKGNLPLAGLVLTSAFTRATGDMAHNQIAAQLSTVPGGDAILAKYDAAMEEFIAGRPVTMDETLPEGIKQLIQAITLPINQPFARELWIYRPGEKLAEVKAPVLIVLGKKDIQVDWQADGMIFESVAKEHNNVSVHYSENANHVLKFEPKPRSELTPAYVMASYSADDTALDPDPVDTILGWLKEQA